MSTKIPEENPIQNQLRKERRAARLGENPACIFCGHSKPEALTLASKKWLEDHHVFVKWNDEKTTAPLCLNCHRSVTEAAYDSGAMRKPTSCLERLELMLRSLGSFMIELGKRLLDWADEVSALVLGGNWSPSSSGQTVVS